MQSWEKSWVNESGNKSQITKNTLYLVQSASKHFAYQKNTRFIETATQNAYVQNSY